MKLGLVIWIILSFLFIPLISSADEVVIENTISVSAQSGGQSATGGEVKSGEAKVSIDIQEKLNGEVVTSFHETTSSATGGVQLRFETSTKKASSTSSFEIQSQVKKNSKQNFKNFIQESISSSSKNKATSTSYQTVNPWWKTIRKKIQDYVLSLFIFSF